MNVYLHRTIKINPIKYELEIIKRLAENGGKNVSMITTVSNGKHSYDRYRADVRAGMISVGRKNDLESLGINCDSFMVSQDNEYV